MYYSVIVVSPLTALIKDQIVSCTLLNIPATHLTSESTVDDLKQARIIYSSPESLLDDSQRQKIISISFYILGVVVDEAHLIVKWYVFYFPSITSTHPTSSFRRVTMHR